MARKVKKNCSILYMFDSTENQNILKEPLEMDKSVFLDTHISLFSVLLYSTNNSTIERHTSCGNTDLSSVTMSQDKSLLKLNVPLKGKPFEGSSAELIPEVSWRSGFELVDARALLWLPGCERRGLLRVKQLRDWASGHKLRQYLSSESQILCWGHGRTLKKGRNYQCTACTIVLSQ